MTQDRLGNLALKVAMAPAVPNDNTLQVGETIDLAGYLDCEFIIATGTLADANATFTAEIYEDDAANMGTEAAAAAADKFGTFTFDYSADKAAWRIGYRGTKRYIRVKIAPAGNSDTAPLCVIAVLGQRVAV